jgi:hypothetical protein
MAEDRSQDLFFETFYPASGPITRSLFEDELSRARKKASRAGIPPHLLDPIVGLSSATARCVPLANDPTSFPDFGFSAPPPHVKVRSIDLHGFNESGTRVATRRMILNRDPAHAYLIKLITGSETHTVQGKHPVVRDAAIRVCEEHGYETFANPGNAGIVEFEIPAGSSQNDDEE